MKKKSDQIPEFKTLEEEKEYWNARGPLAEGHKGTINKPRKNRSSFLAVRLTDEEITRLRDIAVKQGLGPSTYARILINNAMNPHKPDAVDLNEIKAILEKLPSQIASNIYNVNKSDKQLSIRVREKHNI
jgi:hypothetical protein